MCVIFLANKVRPTEEMVDRAWNHNKDGFGIAWRTTDREQRELVAWEKGVMDLERAQELCRTKPLPYVAHFRVASVGGVKQSLTHPFLIGTEASLDLKGKTTGGVLFHNGHWSPWNDKVLDAAIHSNNKIPEGSDWSDSRGMAFLVSIYGPGLMELLTTQKGVIMTPRDFNVFTGTGWDKINDVWCSNDYFWGGRRNQWQGHGNNASYGKMCSYGTCTTRVFGGKEICDSCLKKRQEAGQHIAGTADSSVGQSQALAVVTGGADRGPLAKMFSMPEVENFQKAGLISKSMLKKYRKANSNRHQKSNKAQDRALKQMREMSEVIAESLIVAAGSAH